MNENAERDRIKTIINSDAGRAMPTLANALAFDSAVSADAAAKILTAAKADIDQGIAQANAQSELSAGALGRSFADHKAGSGTLGLVDGGIATDAAEAGWKSAVESANQRFESGSA